jgi:diphthamide synthase (EF-2-diphthine--ammonia ligase)
MNGIPIALLQAQADSIGLPIYVLDFDPEGEMKGYETTMLRVVEYFKLRGVTHFIFGDIFLHDVRSYRESQLRPHGIEVVEPLLPMKPLMIFCSQA